MNAAAEPRPSSPASAMESPFIVELVRLWRAQDAHGVWERKTDEAMLSPYIVTKEQRRAMPIIADPDERTLWRIEMFYNAIGIALERRAGVVATPMMKMHHEGFGRIVLIAGNLVVMSRHLRDAHRFGFESMEKLAAEGEKLVDTAAEMVRTFPDLANFNN